MAGRAPARLKRPARQREGAHGAEGAPPANTEQDTPAPLRDLLGFQLRRAHFLFALHWQLSFRDQPVPVTPVQGGLLLVVARFPGLSQVALARLMDVEGPTLLQVVERLEEAGLLRRVRRNDDRRSYALHVTPDGHAALAAVASFVPHREAELLVDLTEQERATLLDMLQRIVRRGHMVTDALARQAPPPAPVRGSRPRLRRSPGLNGRTQPG